MVAPGHHTSRCLENQNKQSDNRRPRTANGPGKAPGAAQKPLDSARTPWGPTRTAARPFPLPICVPGRPKRRLSRTRRVPHTSFHQHRRAARTMDFSEIGVRSRKTGLTAPQNVRRDAHGMEDVDRFFEEEGSSTQPTSATSTAASTHQMAGNNGRTMFQNMPSATSSSRAGSRRRTPLLSPLPSKEKLGSADDDDRFDDALETQPLPSSTQEMDIDAETRGSIRLVNAVDYDTSMGGNDDDILQRTPNQKLFVSDSDEYEAEADHRNKTFEQRQLELERNTTVRSSIRRPASLSRDLDFHRTPPRFETSPLNSMPRRLYSPLQPSSISAMSKSIATNKRGRPTDLLPTNYDDDDDDYDNYEVESHARTMGGRDVDQDSDLESQVRTKPRKRTAAPKKAQAKRATTTSLGNKAKSRRALAPPRKIPPTTEENSDDSDDDETYAGPRGGRVNKFQRSTSRGSKSKAGSPVRPKEHHIDIERLRNDQESRASSRPPESRATRRSSRIRTPTLAFWRNERQVFQRSKTDQLPSLQQVVTVDELDDAPKRSRAPSRARSKSRGRSNARSKSRSRTSRHPSQSRRRLEQVTENEDEDEDDDEIEVGNGEVPGSEWMKTGFLKIDAYKGHGSEDKSKRLVAWGPNTQNYSAEIVTPDDNFKLAILFDANREFIASGMMLIPGGGKKNMKSTDGTYFVFYCIQGVIQVTLSGSVFMIKKGCSLEVPMGNFYEFINVGKKDATLFFVQTKGQEADEYF